MTYSGDTNFLATTSGNIDVKVSPAPHPLDAAIVTAVMSDPTSPATELQRPTTEIREPS